jgi:hypothetical protein
MLSPRKTRWLIQTRPEQLLAVLRFRERCGVPPPRGCGHILAPEQLHRPGHGGSSRRPSARTRRVGLPPAACGVRSTCASRRGSNDGFAARRARAHARVAAPGADAPANQSTTALLPSAVERGLRVASRRCAGNAEREHVCVRLSGRELRDGRSSRPLGCPLQSLAQR